VWPIGAVWLATHFYEHYEFNGDLCFLRERAYPVMKEADRFVLDFLVEAPPGTACPGALVTNPSFSSENSYRLLDGSKGLLSYTCSMDLELIRQLFQASIEAAKRLGVNTGFRDRLQRTLCRLPPLQVGKHGQLQEWIEDYDETESLALLTPLRTFPGQHDHAARHAEAGHRSV
jgi:alpha-L-fucosidase 2